jgi:hypothetical protein
MNKQAALRDIYRSSINDEFEKIARPMAERQGRGKEVRVSRKSVKAFLAKSWKADPSLRKAYRKNSKRIGINREPGELRSEFLADLGISSSQGSDRGVPFGGFGRVFYATPDVAKKLNLEMIKGKQKAYDNAQDALKKYKVA